MRTEAVSMDVEGAMSRSREHRDIAAAQALLLLMSGPGRGGLATQSLGERSDRGQAIVSSRGRLHVLHSPGRTLHPPAERPIPQRPIAAWRPFDLGRYAP